jgi:hypothetical protein
MAVLRIPLLDTGPRERGVLGKPAAGKPDGDENVPVIFF